MADKFGSYAAAFYFSGAVLIAGASISLLLKLIKQPARTEDSKEEKGQEIELLVVERVTVL